MADWQRTLNLHPEFGMAKKDEISIQELAALTAKRLAALSPFGDERIDDERDELVGEFESLAADETATTANFDTAFAALYDWADTPLDDKFGGKKVCWVRTF